MPATREIITGKNVILEVLRAGRRKIFKIFWARKSHDTKSEELKDRIASQKIPFEETSYEALTRLTGSTEHQGIAAHVADFQYAELEAVVQKAKGDPKGGFLVLLDEIQDPHNVGAIIRTAHLCGAGGLILMKHRQALVTNAVCKASAGAQEYLPVVKVINMVNAINYLKNNNFLVYGGSDGGGSLYQQKIQFPCGLVLGSEGKGLRRLTKENCDALISIPMEGTIDSFNVSVAGGILMGEILRQRLAFSDRLR